MAYIPSINRNLISIPILDRLEYSFLLELEKLIYIETLYNRQWNTLWESLLIRVV